jgi:OmpA-OmpF porin, OOP family
MMTHPLRAIARWLLSAGLLGSMSLITTACAIDPKPCPTGPVYHGLAIAVGDRANSARPAWTSGLDPALTKIINEAEKGAHDGVTFVRVDGNPTIGCVRTLDTNANNGPAKKNFQSQFVNAVQGEVAKLPAKSPQADPLTALSRASAAAGPGGTVVLMDSGLQTVPPLNFKAEDLLDADIGLVVSELAKANDLPDLRGQDVILDGIGYTSPPQRPLDPSQIAHLVKLWQKIVIAAGAASVKIVTTPNTTPSVSGLPAVATVPVPPPGNIALGCDKRSVLSNNGPVGFIANSTTFRDESAARQDLTRIANWLAKNRTAHAILTGSIAHYGPNVRNGGLALARASSIRAVLLSLGVQAGQVTAVGMGWGPFPTKTAPPNPLADPLNRRVVVELKCT